MNRWHKRNTPERNSSGEETEKTEGEEQTAENMEKEIGEKMEASGVHGESTDSSGEEGIEDPEERMADLMTAVGKLLVQNMFCVQPTRNSKSISKCLCLKYFRLSIGIFTPYT